MQYKVKMKSDDFFKIHNRLKVINMEIENKNIIFEIDVINYKVLKECGYEFELIDSLYNKYKNLISKYYLLIVGFLFMLSIIYIDSYRVSNIVFNNETPINDEIEEIIKSKFRKLTIYDYSSIDYQELSNELRQAYSSYPYINVYKENDIIKVDIHNYNEKIPEELYYTNSGDIIAKKDAVVDQFYIYNGSLNVYKNKYVKEGDILINSKLGDDLFVAARGLIFGYTYEKVKIIIDKERETYVYSGLQDRYIQVSFFSFIFNINKNFEFNIYDTQEMEKFNLFSIFSIKEIVDKEKNVIISTCKKEDALKEANQIIDNNFELGKTNNLEKIIDRYVYSVIENNNAFEIEIILKKYESIGIFNER